MSLFKKFINYFGFRGIPRISPFFKGGWKGDLSEGVGQTSG